MTSQKISEQFTKYEIARIIGARALQIAMDAPILVKMSPEELKGINYDSLKIAEKELDDGALPISVHRPVPRRLGGRLTGIKEEAVSDEELIEKEQELEKEIAEEAKQMGLVNEDDDDEGISDDSSSNED